MANDIKYLRIDPDGVTVAVTEHLMSISAIDAITPKETLIAGVWTKITSRQETDLVAWKVTEVRVIPGNAVQSSRPAGDDIVEFISTILKDASAITPSITEATGSITKVYAEPVSDLVSNEVTSVKVFLDQDRFSASIPVIIPERFRGIVETDEESHIIAGVAAAPTLGAGELERIEEQLTALLKRVSVRKFGSVTLPVVLTDTAIDKNGIETTLVFTFDSGEQVLNSGAAANFSQGEVTHIGAGFTLMTEIFDTLPSPWRTSTEPDKDGVVLTTKKRKNLVSGITAGETVVSNVWTRVSAEAENGTIADEVQVSRSVA